MRRRVTTLVLVLSLVVVVRAQVAPHRFGLDDFSRVVRVANPQFAPDGHSIAVVESKANLDEDRYDATLVLVDVARGTSKTLVGGTASTPARGGRPTAAALRISQRCRRRGGANAGVRRDNRQRTRAGDHNGVHGRAAIRVVARRPHNRVRHLR